MLVISRSPKFLPIWPTWSLGDVVIKYIVLFTCTVLCVLNISDRTMICWRHTYKGGNWKPSDKSGVYAFSFTASFNTPTCCESRGWKFTSTKQVGHLGLISSPGVVFLDVSRNHWWLGWVMIHHATITPPPLVELKKPVRKFWWNKFKQHSREAWCNWPGKHPWKEFLGKKCQLLRWVGEIEPHHIAWDLRRMT